MKCINCGKLSFLKSNFKFTPDGSAYCLKECSKVYEHVTWNKEGARQKGYKPE